MMLEYFIITRVLENYREITVKGRGSTNVLANSLFQNVDPGFQTRTEDFGSWTGESITRLLGMLRTYKLVTASVMTARTRLVLQFRDSVVWK